MRVELVDPGRDAVEAELAAILVDAVDGGASVGFLAGLADHTARRWWHQALRADGTLTWVWRDAGDTALGVVQLRLAAPPNASHRGEVAKLLVHRSARGRGVARSLMQALEQEARRRGRWLLLLDTQTGSEAEQRYERWGWQRVGVVAEHAATPDGHLAPTTFLTKRL